MYARMTAFASRTCMITREPPQDTFLENKSVLCSISLYTAIEYWQLEPTVDE